MSATIDAAALRLVQSEDQSQLFDVIDSLRSEGIGEEIPLPQIIVCGDQSAGKSSVLEAISGVSFPTKDDVCTLFATELVLRRAPSSSNSVTIRPGSSRTEEEATILKEFRAPSPSPGDFPSLIEQAKRCMESCGRQSGLFCDDVLRVESCGPDRPHLTLVDLPGLFHSSSSTQTDEDRELVRDLVKKYMKNPQSIILAILSARQDMVTQVVLKMIAEPDIDPTFCRTIGIITKPDQTEGPHSAQKWLRTARNEETALARGWHVLKNRGVDNKDATLEERNQAEIEFFSKGDWATLPKHQVGIASLIPRLNKVLYEHICAGLPEVAAHIKLSIDNCKARLKKLGDPRPTLKEQRNYLLRISSDFHTLMQKAVEGHYNHSFFESVGPEERGQRRLRATVEKLNRRFCAEMRQKGHAWQLVAEAKPGTRGSVTREAYLEHIRGFIEENQGLGLPGTSDPLLIGPLFREQSAPWEDIAERYVEDVWTMARRCIQLILKHITDGSPTCDRLRVEHIDLIMQTKLEILDAKLKELLRPHRRHAMTYDPEWNQMKSSRHVQQETKNYKDMLSHLSKRPGAQEAKLEAPVKFLQRQNIESLAKSMLSLDYGVEKYTSSDLLDDMLAYYQIALRTFIDNVCSLAVENCLMEELPEILSPQVVADEDIMDAEKIKRLASEPEAAQAERKALLKRLEALEKGRRYISLAAPSVQDAPLPSALSNPQSIPSIREHPVISTPTWPPTPFDGAQHSRKSSSAPHFHSTLSGSLFDDTDMASLSTSSESVRGRRTRSATPATSPAPSPATQATPPPPRPRRKPAVTAKQQAILDKIDTGKMLLERPDGTTYALHHRATLEDGTTVAFGFRPDGTMYAVDCLADVASDADLLMAKDPDGTLYMVMERPMVGQYGTDEEEEADEEGEQEEGQAEEEL